MLVPLLSRDLACQTPPGHYEAANGGVGPPPTERPPDRQILSGWVVRAGPPAYCEVANGRAGCEAGWYSERH